MDFYKELHTFATIKESCPNGYEEKHIFKKKQAKDQTCGLLYCFISNIVPDFVVFITHGQVASQNVS